MTDRVKSLLPKIIDYLKGKPVLRAWIFGSYSRGEETENSDIDILVDYEKDANLSLLGICGMMIDLEDILGIKVDLVENGRLKQFAANSVDRDKILIYERTAER